MAAAVDFRARTPRGRKLILILQKNGYNAADITERHKIARKTKKGCRDGGNGRKQCTVFLRFFCDSERSSLAPFMLLDFSPSLPLSPPPPKPSTDRRDARIADNTLPYY